MAFVVVVYAVTLLASALVFALVTGASRLSRDQRTLLAVLALMAYAAVLALGVGHWLVGNAAVLAAAVAAGLLLARPLRSEGSLISFLVAGAVVDTVSATSGPTRALIAAWAEGRSTLLERLALSIPGDGRLTPVIGVADLLFLAVVFACLRRLGHGALARFAVPVGGVVCGLTIAFLTGFVAALPSLAAATVLYLMLLSRRLRQPDTAARELCKSAP